MSQGLSLAEIGRRFGRHESTVAYWVEKHGLRAANHGMHVGKGGLAQAELEPLVEIGMSIAQIAVAVDRSKATVRHWLIRYGMKTQGGCGRRPAAEARAAKQAGLAVVTMHCKHRGETDFWLSARRYYRCKRCRSEAVVRRRRKMKTVLVEEAGGACCICGYSRSMRALHFHHLEPSQKRHEINAKGVALALETLRAEARNASFYALIATRRSRMAWLSFQRTCWLDVLRGSTIW